MVDSYKDQAQGLRCVIIVQPTTSTEIFTTDNYEMQKTNKTELSKSQFHLYP